MMIVKDGTKTFLVRIVREGDRYGLDNCLTHKGESMVEFFDHDYAFDKDVQGRVLGQFVSRYYISTLKSHRGGLNLYGSEPKWSVSALAMDQVMEYIAYENFPEEA
jgi:hypothetical protein